MIFLTLEATLINELDFISYLSRRVLYAFYVREPHILQGFVMWQIQAECWENTRKAVSCNWFTSFSRFIVLKQKRFVSETKKNTNSDLVYLVANSRKTNEKG